MNLEPERSLTFTERVVHIGEGVNRFLLSSVLELFFFIVVNTISSASPSENYESSFV